MGVEVGGKLAKQKRVDLPNCILPVSPTQLSPHSFSPSLSLSRSLDENSTNQLRINRDSDNTTSNSPFTATGATRGLTQQQCSTAQISDATHIHLLISARLISETQLLALLLLVMISCKVLLSYISDCTLNIRCLVH